MEIVKLIPNSENYSKYIPVCLADNELYLREKNSTSGGCTVLRVVTKESLDWNRSEEGIREYVKELWQLAVAGDSTELGLSDFIEEEYDLDEMDNDPEYFINKEDTGADVFDVYDGLREMCDATVEEETGDEVGTWEVAGWYAPELDKVQILFDKEYEFSK